MALTTQDLAIMAMQRIMAKTEIHKRTANVFTWLWKKFVVGETLDLPWPRGWSKPDDQGNSTQSADPNDHYRWWLEKHVGKQGWDWHWEIAYISQYDMPPPNDYAHDRLRILFRKGKEQQAMMFALRFM